MTEARREQLRKQALLAHSIAQQAADGATCEEALETLDLAKRSIERSMMNAPATVSPIIRDKWGQIVETPDVFDTYEKKAAEMLRQIISGDLPKVEIVFDYEKTEETDGE